MSSPVARPGGTTLDPRHVLVLLSPDWPGPGERVEDLSVDALLGGLVRNGFIGHQALTQEESRAILARYPIGAAILDLWARPVDLYGTYELVHSLEAGIPCLMLGHPADMPSGRQAAVLDQFEEFVRIDEASSIDGIMLYLRAVLQRAYPGWEHKTTPAPTATEQPAAGALNQLVCVFSAKGGTGKTTVACNLAVTLVKERKRRVALIDGDLYFGDLDIALNLPSSTDPRRRGLQTVSEALRIQPGAWDDEAERALQGYDQRLLDQVLYTHTSGLRALPAPPRPEMAERVPPQVFRRTIELSQRSYEYTIVDMRSGYSEVEMQVLETATRIVVVLKPEVAILRNTTQFFEYAAQFGWRDKVVPVLNRADSNRFTQISQTAVEELLGASVVPIASAGIVPQAASEGRALVEAYPESQVAASLRALVDIIDGPASEPPRQPPARRGLRGLLSGGLPMRRSANATS